MCSLAGPYNSYSTPLYPVLDQKVSCRSLYTTITTLHTITMAPTFTHEFSHAAFKGKVEVPTGLYINGKWTTSVDKNAKTIE